MCFDDDFYMKMAGMRKKYVGDNENGLSKFACRPSNKEEEWTCPRCSKRNASENEVCMGAEMGDGRCGHPKPIQLGDKK